MESLNVIFDRRTGSLQAPDLRAVLHARLIQASHRALAPIGYLGVSRVHSLINRLSAPRTSTTIIDEAGAFTFPSGDYYWNRLLDVRWSYEPELDFLLQAMADVPYIFLDLGANFGFWSARVSSEAYGRHSVIAVEASKMCIEQLTRNIAGRENVAVHHRAIDETSGQMLKLYGDRHAGFSIDPSWYGASRNSVNEVRTICIDDLVVNAGIDVGEIPLLVKLDVEGVELRALKGAHRIATGKSAFLVEDADFGNVSDAVRFAHSELGMTLYHFADGRFSEIDYAGIEKVKSGQSRLQGTGLNLLATASPFWRLKIEEIGSELAS